MPKSLGYVYLFFAPAFEKNGDTEIMKQIFLKKILK